MRSVHFLLAMAAILVFAAFSTTGQKISGNMAKGKIAEVVIYFNQS
ncbi:MAG: hypothetical protein J5I94_24275 [Phaeodactylibacter sp.]|nr:hypothetical protein [Phaeodactylibacter sp.]